MFTVDVKQQHNSNKDIQVLPRKLLLSEIVLRLHMHNVLIFFANRVHIQFLTKQFSSIILENLNFLSLIYFQAFMPSEGLILVPGLLEVFVMFSHSR